MEGTFFPSPLPSSLVVEVARELMVLLYSTVAKEYTDVELERVIVSPSLYGPPPPPYNTEQHRWAAQGTASASLIIKNILVSPAPALPRSNLIPKIRQRTRVTQRRSIQITGGFGYYRLSGFTRVSKLGNYSMRIISIWTERSRHECQFHPFSRLIM